MSKRDRQGVRLPADIERKYNLGGFIKEQRRSSQLQDSELGILRVNQNQLELTTEEKIELLKEVNASLEQSLTEFKEKTDNKVNQLNEAIQSNAEAIESTNENVSKNASAIEENADEISAINSELATIFSKNHKVLWDGVYYMSAAHTATLSEKVSAQANGIALVFCSYNSASDTNWGWIVYEIPKTMVARDAGSSSVFLLYRQNFTAIGVKNLYINDDAIIGHANNTATGTANGITYANNKFVLRYVFGY